MKNIFLHLISFSFNLEEPVGLLDVKAKAVDEMMNRIKKGIILRPIKRVQVENRYTEGIISKKKKK